MSPKGFLRTGSCQPLGWLRISFSSGKSLCRNEEYIFHHSLREWSPSFCGRRHEGSAPSGAGRGLSDRPLHPFGPLTFEFECGESKIQTPKMVRRMHFNNVNKERHYEYGEQYDSSELVFNMISDEI